MLRAISILASISAALTFMVFLVTEYSGIEPMQHPDVPASRPDQVVSTAQPIRNPPTRPLDAPAVAAPPLGIAPAAQSPAEKPDALSGSLGGPHWSEATQAPAQPGSVGLQRSVEVTVQPAQAPPLSAPGDGSGASPQDPGTATASNGVAPGPLDSAAAAAIGAENGRVAGPVPPEPDPMPAGAEMAPDPAVSPGTGVLPGAGLSADVGVPADAGVPAEAGGVARTEAIPTDDGHDAAVAGAAGRGSEPSTGPVATPPQRPVQSAARATAPATPPDPTVDDVTASTTPDPTATGTSALDPAASTGPAADEKAVADQSRMKTGKLWTGCTKFKTYSARKQAYRGLDGLLHECKTEE